jgi:2-polyprenyl-3-methyl-5-hydroxy-6-metoxy-1,4-benzoquinol methylase
MIICPKCETILTKKSDCFECEKCQYKALIDRGIVCFNPEIDDSFSDYDPAALEIFYQHEKQHFWFRTRRDVIKDLFGKYVNKEDKVIEIGAGTGNISKMLLRAGYNVAIGDVHKKALYLFKSHGVKEKYQFDINQSPFRDHFDVVGMFDVLEHIKNDEQALESVSKILKDHGKIILTVPAHKWLWSRHDYSHKRRYNLGRIRKIFKKNNLKILEAKHFFVSIVPLLLARSFLQSPFKGKLSARKLAEEQININPILNNILYALLCFEYKIIKNITPKIGGSILVVAEKRK